MKEIGILWVKDDKKEVLTDTLDNGIKYFKSKYNTYPEFIECSILDSNVEFEHNGTKVIPKRYFQKGIIWMVLKA